MANRTQYMQKGTQQFPTSAKKFSRSGRQIPGRVMGTQNATANPYGKKGYAAGTAGGIDEVAQIFGQNLIGKKLSYKLTTDGTYANGVIPIIPQFRDETLPTGVAFSGSNYSTYALFAKFAAEQKLVLGRLQVTTDNTANFSEAIKITTYLSNGASYSLTETWDSLTKDVNAQDQGTRYIEDTQWICGDLYHRYEIATMADSTYFQFTFEIVGVGGKVLNVSPAF